MHNAIIASDIGEFFAPTQYGALDMLLAEHGKMRERIEQLAELMTTEIGGAVPFFLDGESRRYRGGSLSASKLFRAEPAVKALDAHFWRRALDLSGVRDLLPQDKRDGWDKDIEHHKTPPFAEEWVNPTIRDLLDSRERFFLEKVDGIFRALSRSHVTNRPEGFGMRFIFCGTTPADHKDTPKIWFYLELLHGKSTIPGGGFWLGSVKMDLICCCDGG
jgi:hypothetical protein